MTNAERHAQQAATLERLIAAGVVEVSDTDDHGNTAGLLLAKLTESAERG